MAWLTKNENDVEVLKKLKKTVSEMKPKHLVWGEKQNGHGPEIFDAMNVCLKQDMEFKFHEKHDMKLFREFIKKHNLNIIIGFLDEFEEDFEDEFDLRMKSCFRNLRELKDDGSFIVDLYINMKSL